MDKLKSTKTNLHMKSQIASELISQKTCQYSSYKCSHKAMKKYNYCQHHILSDKTAPFRQCSFIYSGGKHCFYPAYKAHKKEVSFCNEHALKSHLMKAKQGTRMQAPTNAESILTSLSHYMIKPKTQKDNRLSPDISELKVTKSLDPMTDVDASSVIASYSDVLDLCSDDESDMEATTFSNVWLDAHADSSEDESIDSDNEDLLKHADVLSAEEITKVTKDKLIKLHSLYVNQYSHLYHQLKEKRRSYIHALKREKETCSNIRNQVLERPSELAMFNKLKQYNQYHKKRGTDAILRKRLMEMRTKITEGLVHKPTSYSCRCTFSEGGIKCMERALPVAKHCRRHILKDANQVLFRACGKKGGEVVCETAVESIFEDQACMMHRAIPPRRVYSQARKESESDFDDTLDTSIVKTEYLNEIADLEMDVIPKDETLSADEDALTSDSAPYFKLEASSEHTKTISEEIDVESTSQDDIIDPMDECDAIHIGTVN